MLFKEVKENLSIVGEAGGDEIAQATAPQKALLGAMGVCLAFEWGTGNEALMGWVGGNMIQLSHNALVTATATGGASFCEQAAFGLVATATAINFPRTATAIKNRFFPDTKECAVGESATMDADKPLADDGSVSRSKPAGLIGRFTTAFALGTALPILGKGTRPEHTTAMKVKEVLGDAALIGLGVSAIAGAAAGLNNAGDMLGMQQQAQIAVDVIKNPALWGGLFCVKLITDRKRKSKAKVGDMQEVSI